MKHLTSLFFTLLLSVLLAGQSGEILFAEAYPDGIRTWGKFEIGSRGKADRLPFSDGEPAFFSELNLATASTEGRKNDILVYVHGMNGDREPYYSNVLRQMRRDYLENADCPIGQIVCFVWKPPFRYYPLIKNRAVPLFADVAHAFFQKMTDWHCASAARKGGSRLHLMSNSMGIRLIKLGFAGLSPPPSCEPFFENIVFGAPDMEVIEFVSSPVFNEKLPLFSRKTWVLTNRYDFLLFLASLVNRQPMLGRRGAIGAERLPDQVEFIEMTSCRNRRFSGWLTQHFYFSQCPAAVEILQKVWADGPGLRPLARGR